MELNLTIYEVNQILTFDLPKELDRKIRDQSRGERGNKKSIKRGELKKFLDSLNGEFIEAGFIGGKDQNCRDFSVYLKPKIYIGKENYKKLLDFTNKIHFSFRLEIKTIKLKQENSYSNDDEILFYVNIIKLKDFVNSLNDGSIRTFKNKEDEKNYIQAQGHNKIKSFIDKLQCEDDIKSFYHENIEKIKSTKKLPLALGDIFTKEFKERCRELKEETGVIKL